MTDSRKGVTARCEQTQQQPSQTLPLKLSTPYLSKRLKSQSTTTFAKHRNSIRSQQNQTQQSMEILAKRRNTNKDLTDIEIYNEKGVNNHLQSTFAAIREQSKVVKAKALNPYQNDIMQPGALLKRKKFKPVLLGVSNQTRQRTKTSFCPEKSQSQECLVIKPRSITQQSIARLERAYVNSTPKFAVKNKLKAKGHSSHISYFDLINNELTMTPTELKTLKHRHQSQEHIKFAKDDSSIRLLTNVTRNIHKVTQELKKQKYDLLDQLKAAQISLDSSSASKSFNKQQEIAQNDLDRDSTEEIMIQDDGGYDDMEVKKQRSASLEVTVVTPPQESRQSYLQPTISSATKKEILIVSVTERVKHFSQQQQTPVMRDCKTAGDLLPASDRHFSASPKLAASQQKQTNCNQLQNNEEDDTGEGNCIQFEQQEELVDQQDNMSSSVQNQYGVLHVNNGQQQQQQQQLQQLQQQSGKNLSSYISTQSHRAHLHSMITQGAANSYTLPRQQKPVAAAQNFLSPFTQTMPSGTIDMNSVLLTSGTRVRTSKSKATLTQGDQQQLQRSQKPVKYMPQQQNKLFAHVKSGGSPAASFKDNLDYVIANRIQLQEILNEATTMQQRLPNNNQKNVISKTANLRKQTEDNNNTIGEQGRKKRGDEEISGIYLPYAGNNKSGRKAEENGGARSIVKVIHQQTLNKSKQNNNGSYVTSPQRKYKAGKQHTQTYISFKTPIVLESKNSSGIQSGRRSTNFAMRNSQQRKATITVGSSSSNLIQPSNVEYKELKEMTTPGIAVIPPHRVPNDQDYGSKVKSKAIQQSTKQTPAKAAANRTTRSPVCDENAYGQKAVVFTHQDEDDGLIINNRVSNLSKEASKRIKTDEEHFGTFRITMTAQQSRRDRRQIIRNSIAGLSSSTAVPGSADYGQQRKQLKQQLQTNLAKDNKSRQLNTGTAECNKKGANTEFIVAAGPNEKPGTSYILASGGKTISPNCLENLVDPSEEPPRVVVSYSPSMVDQRNASEPELVGPPPAAFSQSLAEKAAIKQSRGTSKSPNPVNKKSSSNQAKHLQQHLSNQQAQSQSIKQLGLSYGVLSKQDGYNKLNGSKTKQRGSPVKKNSVAHQRKQVIGKSLMPWQHDSQVSDLMLKEGNQITYDEQNQQMSQTTLQGFNASMRKQSKPLSRGITTDGPTTLTGAPGSRFQSAMKTTANSMQNSTIQQAVQNQLIMKRMPELQVAPTITSAGVMNHLLPQTQRGRLFKYQVFGGNNAQLIKRVMSETRSYLWVEMANNQQSHYHFRWAPTSRSINFDRLSHNFGQMANHFENHQEITTKNELFKNWKHYSDERSQNAFHTIPLTFCLKISADRQTQSIKQQLKPFKDVFNLMEEFKDKFVPPEEVNEEDVGNSSPEQPMSPVSVSTTTEKQQLSPYEQITKSPMTVLVTQKGKEVGYSHPQETDYKSRDNKKRSSDNIPNVRQFTSKSSGLFMPMSHFAGQNVWILKPTGFNCGKGIHVVNSLVKLKKLIKEYSRGKEASLMGSTMSPASTTMFPPSSKFVEPQAVGTQQLTLSTIQTATQKGQPIPQLPFTNSKQMARHSISSQVPAQQPAAKFINTTTTRNMQNVKSSQDADRIEETQPDDGTEVGETATETIGIEQPQASQPTVIMPMKTEAAKAIAITTSTTTNTLIYQKPSIRSQTFIIQKYIERPLLIRQRKFDIRVWVTLTHDMDIYFFKEGYLRTSSQPYSMDASNLDDDFVHLTNNAIQKNSPEYGNHEDGNMLSFKEFKKFMKKSGSQADFEVDILQKMKYLSAVTLSTIKKKINPNRRKHCFELFGLDFFIDNDYNVFLIEVNTNPCLQESSGLLANLLPRLLDDLFKLTIDQIYLPTKDIVQQSMKQQETLSEQRLTQRQMTGKSPYSVEGYRDRDNMWEKIGSLKTYGTQSPILVSNPHSKQPTQSDRLIHLVNKFEMRVAKPDLVEKAHKRDLAQNGKHQLAGFVDY